MNLEEFHQDLMTTVRVAAEVNRDFIRTAFVKETGSRLSDAEEISDFQDCQFEGTGSRSRRIQVDGYSIDEVDGSMALVIAEFSNEEELQSFGATEARRSFAGLKAFVDEALEGGLTDGSRDEASPGYGLATEIVRLRQSISRFRFYLVSDAKLSTRILEWPEDAVQGIPIDFQIWDVERFHRAHESASGRDALEVTFCDGQFEGLPCLETADVGGEYEAYLCMIPGQLLAGIYERFGSRLLEGNVRSFLTTKGKVNAGMQETIRACPEMFFAYNNGIAATAEAVVLDPSGMRLLNATNLQIVNGGQTTASIAAAKRNGDDLSRVRVQMKLSVVAPEKAAEMIPLIARFANSQNKVSDADFFANHPYHIRLEELSRKLWTPPPPGMQYGSHWFYERARGQYLNEQARMTRSQKDQFLLQNPKAQLLKKTDIAKFVNTWRGLPHKVSLGAQKNFIFFAGWIAKSWKENDEQFDEHYFRHLVALAIVFRHTEAMVSSQSWYQGGYRANVVTYTLAKLQHMILKSAQGSDLDLRAVWDQQDVPQNLATQIRAIAKPVFEVLTGAGRSKDNVTEWAKMERCWDEVMELNIELNYGVLVMQRDPDLAQGNQARKGGTRTIGYGILARTAVINMGGSQWDAMRTWGMDNGLLSERESGLLRAASRVPRFAPSAKDCEKILMIRSKLEAKGYES